MRYLTEQLALGALRRGQAIEQFLGPSTVSDQPGIRHVEIRPTDTFEIYLHLSQDNGNEHFWDIGEFGSLEEREEDEFGRLIARADDPALALDTAEQLLGASRARWVNQGVVQDEYGDYVHAGRPATQTPDGHPWPPETTPPSLTEDPPSPTWPNTSSKIRDFVPWRVHPPGNRLPGWVGFGGVGLLSCCSEGCWWGVGVSE